MKQFYTSIFAIAIACFGAHALGAETKPAEPILLEKVPKAVKEKQTLTPEELSVQRAAVRKASAEFESAVKSAKKKYSGSS
jgi:hypothetical protein